MPIQNLSNYPNIKAIHVIKNERLILEEIRSNETETIFFPVGCIFKSFVSVLVGIAIKERKISSIEDCILDYVPHDDIEDCNWYKLKIKHAMSNTTGLKWPNPYEPIPTNLSDVLQLQFENEPGSVFSYKPDPQIIIYLLEEIYGMEITELFNAKLIRVLPTKDYEWDKADIQGLQVSISLLDELGLLFLNKGVTNGTRLFTEEYYEQCIHALSSGGFPEFDPYGLSWWLNDDADYPYFYASGFGGQYLIIIPQNHMVISMLSDMGQRHPENKEFLKKIIDQYKNY